MKTFTVIGAGRVGQTLAILLKHELSLLQLLNRSLDHAKAAAHLVGQGTPINDYTALKPADLYIIATPDDQIKSAAQALAIAPSFNRNSIVFHCSASLSSSLLSPLKEKGSAIASIHPARSFADPILSAAAFKGTYCAIEGDPDALLLLKSLFSKIGGIVFDIQSDKKVLYHVGGVLSSNYLVTLFNEALKCYQEAGIEPDAAYALVENLMRGVLGNLDQLPPEQALTGPIARGDTSTLQRHLEALRTYPDLCAFYQTLGRYTLELTQHSAAKKQEVLASLAIL